MKELHASVMFVHAGWMAGCARDKDEFLGGIRRCGGLYGRGEGHGSNSSSGCGCEKVASIKIHVAELRLQFAKNCSLIVVDSDSHFKCTVSQKRSLQHIERGLPQRNWQKNWGRKDVQAWSRLVMHCWRKADNMETSKPRAVRCVWSLCSVDFSFSVGKYDAQQKKFMLKDSANRDW